MHEETHQKNEMLEFKGLLKVEDAKRNIKYEAIFVCHQEDIGCVDELDVKTVQMICKK